MGNFEMECGYDSGWKFEAKARDNGRHILAMNKRHNGTKQTIGV